MVKLRMGIILAKNKKDLKDWNKILKVFSFEKIDTLLEKLGILDNIHRANKQTITLTNYCFSWIATRKIVLRLASSTRRKSLI